MNHGKVERGEAFNINIIIILIIVDMVLSILIFTLVIAMVDLPPSWVSFQKHSQATTVASLNLAYYMSRVNLINLL